MRDLEVWQAFVAVAEQGGFSKAAERMRVPVPQVSKRVAKLEEHLKVRLFQRSTRVVRLTDEGKALLPKITTLLSDFGELESSFEQKGELSGTVRVTCVPFVAHRLLRPMVRAFMSKHPKIKIELLLETPIVNLVEAGVDVAIRIDTPTDGDLIYRRLLPNDLVVCAAPEYLRRHKSPLARHSDLASHDLLFMDVLRDASFVKSGTLLSAYAARRRVESDSGELLTEMALDGQGVLVRAFWDVKDALDEGRLVRVLKKDPLETFGHLHAVIPSRRFLAPRVRAFFDYLIECSAAWRS